MTKAHEVKAGDLIRTDEYGDIYVKDLFVNIQLDNRVDLPFHADDDVILVEE